MTERLADVSARISGPSARRGRQCDERIAAARAHTAMAQISAGGSLRRNDLRRHAAKPGPDPQPQETALRTGEAALLFLAEQGFAGVFSERVSTTSESTAPLHRHARPNCCRARSAPNLERADASHSNGIPKLADAITRAFLRPAAGEAQRLDAISTGWASGRPVITRAGLFPRQTAKRKRHRAKRR